MFVCLLFCFAKRNFNARTALLFQVLSGIIIAMHEPLRILQVVNVRWFNATAWYGLFLSRLLKDAGHDVRVLGLAGTESFAKAEALGLSPLGLPLNTANPFAIMKLMACLSSLLHDFSPHIVNCHRGEGMLLWGLLKSRHRFSLIRTRGDQRLPKKNFANKVLHGTVADAVIATNSRTAKACRHLLHVPDDRLFTILGGVDTSVFFPQPEGRALIRSQYGFSDEDIVLGLLGRFDTVKGQKELLEAVARLKQNAANTPWTSRIRIMLMGFSTSVAEEQIQQWISEYGLQDCTVITGKVSHVAAHIAAMDLGVIASQGSEAIARAAFEIMSCGVPLVGTDVGVMPDLLPDWALAPVGNSLALSSLLEKALTDQDFYRSLQDAARKRMHDLSEHDFLEQTVSVYRSVLQTPSAPTPTG